MHGNVRILPDRLTRSPARAVDRLSRVFVRWHVSPNAVTTAGFAAGLVAGVAYGLDRPWEAALALVLCGLLDVLDGRVAVNGHRQSLFGAIYDSTLDRYSEFSVYAGLAVHFRYSWGLWAVLATLVGSVMVSYTRARSEGLGVACRVGLMQRAERLVLLVLATAAGAALRLFDPILLATLTAIAVVSNITALQRVFRVRTVERAHHQEVRP